MKSVRGYEVRRSAMTGIPIQPEPISQKLVSLQELRSSLNEPSYNILTCPLITDIFCISFYREAES